MAVYGEHGDSGEKKLDNSENNFERKKTDHFGFKCIELGKLSKIRIWHDNSGFAPAWFLDKVIITDVETNEKTFFLCGRWLAKDEDGWLLFKHFSNYFSLKKLEKKDGKLEREIAASNADGVTYEPLVAYQVQIFTGDRFGAGRNPSFFVEFAHFYVLKKIVQGTFSRVFLELWGDKSDSGKVEMVGKFDRNSVVTYEFTAVALGKLDRAVISIDYKDSWFLDYFTVRESGTEATLYYFNNTDKWIGKHEGSGSLERELKAEVVPGKASPPLKQYELEVKTGDR